MYYIHIHMNRCDIVLLFQVVRNKSIRAFYAIYKITPSLNHTLIYQLLKRLLLTRQTNVEQKLVPETTVNQVTGCMFSSPDIKINIPPVIICLLRHQSLAIMWIHIAQIVSRRTCETRHSIKFERVTLFCSPVICSPQRRLTFFSRQIFIHLRKLKREFTLIQGVRHSVFVIYRKWLTPIALS